MWKNALDAVHISEITQVTADADHELYTSLKSNTPLFNGCQGFVAAEQSISGHVLFEAHVYVKASSATIALTSWLQVGLYSTCKQVIIVGYDSFKSYKILGKLTNILPNKMGHFFETVYSSEAE